MRSLNDVSPYLNSMQDLNPRSADYKSEYRIQIKLNFKIKRYLKIRIYNIPGREIRIKYGFYCSKLDLYIRNILYQFANNGSNGTA